MSGAALGAGLALWCCWQTQFERVLPAREKGEGVRAWFWIGEGSVGTVEWAREV